MGEHTFLRLYGRLPAAEWHGTDVIGCTAGCRRMVIWRVRGRGEPEQEVHSFWRGKLNRLGRRTKGYRKREGALRDGLAPAWVQHGLI